MAKSPFSFSIVAENITEQLTGFLPVEEMSLIRRPFVGKAGGDSNPFYLKVHHMIKKFRYPPGINAFEKGTVDIDSKPSLVSFADGADRLIEHAGLTHRRIMYFLIAIEVDRKGEIGAGLKQIEAFFKQQGVGAKINKLLSGNQAFDDFLDFPVQQRLPPGYGNDGGTTFINRIKAFLDTQPSIENGIGIIDLAASRTGEITAKQRFQHQHQRITLNTQKTPLDNVGADSRLLNKGDRHEDFSFVDIPESGPLGHCDLGQLRRQFELDVFVPLPR